ncbi:recombination-associated protein RdgC [Vreelandella sp. GE22]
MPLQIPKGTIADAVFERISEREAESEEPVDDDERERIYSDVSMEICKKAFVKTKYLRAFYHLESEFLFIDTTSPGDVSRFMGTLVKLAGKVQTVTIHVSGVKNGVTTRLRDAIEHWNDDAVQPFGSLQPDDRATLKRKMAPDEPVEVVTYKGTWLGVSDELLNQLHAGYEVEEIGLEYPPAAMSFRLTHQFRFKGIDFAPQEPEDGAGEGDDVHDWRMNAMREVEGMVGVVNELCALMEYEQPVLEEEAETDVEPEGDQ